jgi:hypothetical protein
MSPLKVAAVGRNMYGASNKNAVFDGFSMLRIDLINKVVA